MILPKKYTILWKEIIKIVFFWNILYLERSPNEIGGYFVQKYFRTIKFPIFVILWINALFYRPMFKALKNPIDKKSISKIKQILNLNTIENIWIKKYLMMTGKYQSLSWFELDFRCVYFAVSYCRKNNDFDNEIWMKCQNS